MKDLRGTYVHAGDALRCRRRVRAWIMLAGLVLAAALGTRNWVPAEAAAAGTRPALGERLGLGAQSRLLTVSSNEIERWHAIFSYSRRYRIPADLATDIYDAALTEAIDPALAFPLVRLESGFNALAVSPVGAIGLAQLMLPTAREYVPEITQEELFDRDTNLAIGFRHLHRLIVHYHGDVRLALLGYNRGANAVALDQELGIDPSNGYDRLVLRGYRGKGILDN